MFIYFLISFCFTIYRYDLIRLILENRVLLEYITCIENLLSNSILETLFFSASAYLKQKK